MSVRPETVESEHPIVVFDGVCNFCNASVSFILNHDRAQVFRFQSMRAMSQLRLAFRQLVFLDNPSAIC